MTNSKRKIYETELGLQRMENEKRRPRGGMEITQDWPLFGQTPQALVRDSKYSPQAKALYCLYHTYSAPKGLSEKPDTFVSQKILAQNMGWHYNNVSHYEKVLEAAGWITVKRRGFNQSNRIILHGRRKRVRTGRTKE